MGNYKKLKKPILCFLLAMIMLMGLLAPVVNADGGSVKILDVNFEQINLSNPKLVGGKKGSVGATYRYSNVIKINGINIYAKVEILEQENATLVDFDAEGTGQNPSRFEPKITSSASNGKDGYFSFKFSFFEDLTDEPVYLHGFALTAVDIDGATKNGNVGEFQVISGYAKYLIDESSELKISHQSGYTRFDGIVGDLSGVKFDNTAAYIAYYVNPIHSMIIKLGNKGDLSNRQNSINFGNIVGAFTNAKEVPNPDKPTINVSIKDNLDNKYDDLTKVAITGTTNAGIGSTVTISVTDGTSTITNTATVDTDGNYSIEMDLSGLKHGEITVEANVINSSGTPADTAKAKSSINRWYIVTFKDHEGEQIGEPQTVEHGKDATAPAAPEKEGYTFTNWDKGYSNVTGDLEITAQYKVNEYTITFDTDGGVNDTENPDKYTIETKTITLKPATKIGYTFKGWYDDKTEGNKIETIAKGSKGNKTLYARWTVNEYTITFDTDGGVNDTENPDKYTIETKTITLKPATKIGYTFEGWYDDKTEGNKIETIAKGSIGNKTLYARWTVNEYTITFDEGDGTKTEITGDYGTEVTAPSDPERDGYTFDGWDKEVPETIPGEDITITAKWEINQYTITFETAGGSTVDPITQDFDTDITAPANPTKEGYTFKGWDEEIPTTMPAKNMIITATWNGNPVIDKETKTDYETDNKTPVEGEIKAEDPDGDELTYEIKEENKPKHGTIEIDEDGNWEYTPEEGYVGDDEFTVTVKDDEGEEDEITITITVKATLTFKKDKSSEEIIKTEKVKAGEKLAEEKIPEAPEKAGYTFQGWYYKDGEEKLFTKDTEVTKDMEIYGKWEINQYTITFDTDGGSTVDPITQDFDTSITAPANPTKEGYTFKGWDKAIPEKMPAEDIEIKATWTSIDYAITYELDGGTNHGENPDKYTIEDKVELKDAAKTGYTFDGWYDSLVGGTRVTEIAKGSMGEKTLYAKWTINKYMVIFKDHDGTVLKKQEVFYGSDAAAPIVNPRREGYGFIGWDKGYTNITANTVVTAQYEKKEYTVEFKDENENELAVEKKVEYSKSIEEMPDAPVKEGYEFLGWNTEKDGSGSYYDENTPVTGDVTLYPQYEKIKTYTVIFKDYDGTVVEAPQEILYGNKATLPTDPERTSQEFKGWFYKDGDSEVGFTEETIVTRNIIATAKYSPEKYTVKFINKDDEGNETIIEEKEIEYNKSLGTLPEGPKVDGETFIGWNTEESGDGDYYDKDTPVTEGDITLYPIYKEIVPETYTVIFKDYDGSIIDEPQEVISGKTATLPTDPERTGQEFKGWFYKDGDSEAEFTEETIVTRNIIATAKYSPKEYTVKFVDKDGHEITEEERKIEYNKSLGTLPKGPEEKNKTFTGWAIKDDEGNIIKYYDGNTPITEDVTLYAQYEDAKIYTVIFKDYDGTTIGEPQNIEHGKGATAPANPSRENYTFMGWDKPYDNITNYTVVTAKYEKVKHKVTFKDEKGNPLKDGEDKEIVIEIEHGDPADTLPEGPGVDGKTFTGWYSEKDGVKKQYDENTLITEDVTLYPEYEGAKEYTVIFKDYDGIILKTEYVVHGKDAAAPIIPSPRVGYIFDGWDKEYKNVTSNLLIVALYKHKEYTVRFVGEDEKLIVGGKITVKHGETITENVEVKDIPAAPSKPGYEFIGWNTKKDGSGSYYDENTPVTEDVILYPRYEIAKTYTVIFKDYDGTVLKTETVEEGKGATAPANPIRVGHTFTKWDRDFTNVINNFVVTAEYNKNEYTVTFKDEHGNPLLDAENKEVIIKVKHEDSMVDNLPDGEKAGSTFYGWVTKNEDGKVTGYYDKDTPITESIILYPQYDEEPNTTPTVEEKSIIKIIEYMGKADGTIEASDEDEGDTLTFTLLEDISDGRFTINKETGEWKYTAKEDFSGTDTFTVLISDSNGGDVTVTVTIIVKDGYKVTFNSNGGSSMSPILNLVKDSKIGKPTLDPTKTGHSFLGWYKDVDLKEKWNFGEDGDAVTEDTTLYAKWNTIPTVPDYDDIVTDYKTPVSGRIEGNDGDKDPLTYTVYENPSNGKLKLNPDGSWTYTPNDDYSGDDSFEIKVSDGNGGDVISKVNITVKPKGVTLGIEMKATPNSLVADGTSTSQLKARVRDSEGKPVQGVKVVFDAEMGTFPADKTATTDADGYATVEFKSVKIEDTITRYILVTATVNDDVNGLYGEDNIIMTFEPSSVKGVVIDNKTGKPVVGAVVMVEKTFDDGTSYYGECITDRNGEYKLPVPKGDTEYTVKITKPVILREEDEENEEIATNVTFTQNAKVGTISGADKEEFPASETFTGLIIVKDKNGDNEIAGKDGQVIKIKELAADGTVTEKGTIDKTTGLFSIEGLTKGQKYEFLITTTVGGKELLMGKMEVTISAVGEMSIHEELIDPYGTITDASTGKSLDGVKVELFYADTTRNKANSIVPHTSVPLPGIIGFEPKDNANPQNSTKTLIWNGDVNDWANYAWMVFNNTDYYIVATKSSYETYRSANISVDGIVIKHSFKMYPVSSDDDSGSKGGGKKTGPVTPKEEPKPEDGFR